MGFFSKLLGGAIGAGKGFLAGGPAGAVVGGALGLLTSRNKANAETQAGNQASATAQGGATYMQDTVGAGYVPAGVAANNQQAGLLGIGGDPSASQEGYDNYLNSVGYQGQMRAGQQAITSNKAASGLLGSGSTLKALQAHGTQLNAQNFNNYLGQLGGVANRGLQAGTAVGSAVTQGASDAARYQYGAGQQAVESKSSGWDALVGGLGTAYDAWSAGRKKATSLDNIPEPRRGMQQTTSYGPMRPVRI